MSDLYFNWRWTLKAPPEKLWPAVSDTNRFDRYVGLPPLRFEPMVLPGRAPRRRVRTRYYGIPLEWEEYPFEFEEPRRFSVLRRHRFGPAAEVESTLELEPRAAGSELVYRVRVEPRTSLAAPLVRLQIQGILRPRFERAFRAIDAAVVASAAPFREPPALGESFRGRLAEALGAVPDSRWLADYLVEASPFDLWTIRPFQVARSLEIAHDTALDLCLAATRLGVLDAIWQILCPHCRRSKAESGLLAGLTFGSRCEDCNVDFEADFDRLTELVFRLSPRWKRLEVGEYCVGGPGKTPHVAVQFLLPAGAETSRTLTLAEGSYRIRSTSGGQPRFLQVARGGGAEAAIALSPRPQPAGELILGPSCRLRVSNEADSEALVSLERTAWAVDACSAAYVSTFQRYRDLFGRDVLAPGIAVKIGTMALLFTDLKDSTALYSRIGDAPAFGLVRTHFDILRAAVREHDGAVVKTIGDAVMAAFLEPAGAVAAALAMHAAVASLRTVDGEPVVLKIGLHAGPCFAVTLNDNLDYFGNTVNLAARIQGLATGGDVVLDSELAGRSDITALVGSRRRESFVAELKGFRGMRRFVRILAQ